MKFPKLYSEKPKLSDCYRPINPICPPCMGNSMTQWKILICSSNRWFFTKSITHPALHTPSLRHLTWVGVLQLLDLSIIQHAWAKRLNCLLITQLETMKNMLLFILLQCVECGKNKVHTAAVWLVGEDSAGACLI